MPISQSMGIFIMYYTVNLFTSCIKMLTFPSKSSTI